jgi:hypothetical protein
MTTYRAGGCAVRVGQRSACADRLLAARGVREAAFVTAWNPFSRPMAAGWNRRMQARLAAAAPGLPATGGWRRWSEEHALLFVNRRRAAVLAGRFRQNAFVIVVTRQPARLVWTSRSCVKGVT